MVHTDALAFNCGDQWACIATSGDISTDWGLKVDNSWQVPASPTYTNNGLPSYQVFAIEPANLSSFLTMVASTYPQFAQTVQAVFFAPKQLVSVKSSVTFAGTTCNILESSRKTIELAKLDKSMFGYPSQYADLAKLYTSPYAHLEVTDENGMVDRILIEDTTGTIQVSAALSIAYPFVNLQSHLLGVGGSFSQTITFKNLDERSITIGGNWYETLREWKIPTFAIMLDPADLYDYASHFDRVQSKVDYDTTYENTAASASTDKANTATMAESSRKNASDSADTSIANTAIQVSANATITSRSNNAALSDTNLANLLSQASQAYEAGYARATTNNDINAEYASAAIGAAGGVIGSVVNGAMQGGPVGAVGGLISGAISGATTAAQTVVSANLKSSQAEEGISLSQSKVTSTNLNNEQRTTNQNSANTDNVGTTNTAATGITANSAATEKANAIRSENATNATATATYNTNIANADREKSRAQSAIENAIDQAALNAPSVFGNFANGDNAATKPMALFANVVTESKSAIAAAGDEFLRYGYMYDMQWSFDGNWNIGRYFTYWKLKDFWVSDLQVPDLYMDKIRFFLFGGVTIWRRPEYIGKVSIYDNFNEQ